MSKDVSLFERFLYKFFHNFHQNYYMEYKCDAYVHKYKFSFTECLKSYIKREFFRR